MCDFVCVRFNLLIIVFIFEIKSSILNINAYGKENKGNNRERCTGWLILLLFKT